jgi:hypothetical protein
VTNKNNSIANPCKNDLRSLHVVLNNIKIMNTRIESLIEEIASNFKSIYRIDIHELGEIRNADKLDSLSITNISDWSEEEIDIAVEGTLRGINYYLINFVKSDRDKGFPIASYNSVKEIIKNNQKELIIYTKRIPHFNEAFRLLLEKKGIIKS